MSDADKPNSGRGSTPTHCPISFSLDGAVVENIIMGAVPAASSPREGLCPPVSTVCSTFFQPECGHRRIRFRRRWNRDERRSAMADPSPTDPRLRPDNLDHLRKLAKQLLRSARNGDERCAWRSTSMRSNPARIRCPRIAQLVGPSYSAWPIFTIGASSARKRRSGSCEARVAATQPP